MIGAPTAASFRGRTTCYPERPTNRSGLITQVSAGIRALEEGGIGSGLGAGKGGCVVGGGSGTRVRTHAGRLLVGWLSRYAFWRKRWS